MPLIYINSCEAAFLHACRKLATFCCVLLFTSLIGVAAASAGAQPDLLVKLATEGDSGYVGAGVYEATAVTQSRSQAAFAGATAGYRILLRNEGESTDSFLLRGTGSDNGFTVRYLDEGGVDRGAAFAGAGFATASLQPGQSLSFLVQVTPTSLTPGASYRVTVSAVARSDAALVDQVKTDTVVCGSSAAVTVTAPPDGSGAPGSVVYYPYTVTNVGSGINRFTLTVSGAAGWQSAIYADDGSGGGGAGDGVHQPGERVPAASTGPLDPGASYRFFVAVTIPPSSADGAHAETRLAVAGEGTNGADQVTTTALSPTVSLIESVRNITQGGPFEATATALPGETLQYRMSITNSGSAPATSVSIEAPVPQSTTCVAGSLWIGASAGGDGTPCPPSECGSVRENSGGIVARLGQGATDSAGGVLPPGKTLYVFYRVQVE
jgi:uncharacterized repeat protein (TIGR01451 family)